MGLGLKSKHKKGVSIKVDYIVHVQEIRPWPPSESLRSVQTVLLQWENGNENSGSFLSVAGDSNIVFNESFMLPLTLYRDKKSNYMFRKNYLEFSLSEPRKDNAKEQLLGTALLNLADYGLVEDIISINAPLNIKKISSNNLVQPALAISLELVEKDSSNSSPSVGLASMDNDDDDSEIASYTDDDDYASSHSSRTTGSLTFDAAIAPSSQIEKNGHGNGGIERNKNMWPPSTDASLGTWNKVKDYVSLSKLSERSMSFVKKKSDPPLIISAPTSVSYPDSGELNNILASFLRGSVSHDVIAGNQQNNASENTRQTVEDKFFERFAPDVATSTDQYRKNSVKSDSMYSRVSQEKQWQLERQLLNENEKREQNSTGSDEQIMEEKFSEDATTTKRQVTMRSDSLVPNRKGLAVPPSSNNKAWLKHVKSAQIQSSVKGSGVVAADVHSGEKPLDLDIPNGSQKKGKPSAAAIERKEEPKGDLCDDQKEWRTRLEMLEEELREAAVVEVGLYSIVPEHSSSTNKVHAPARRLSRFYNNACRAASQARRASAARAALSGLVLVSKACGNDVSRLTFWLSNSIMLRSIVSQIAAELPHSNESFDDCEDVLTFIIALEKVESWLFSRILESVWWQTFMPHMQRTVGEGSLSHRDIGSRTKKTSGRRDNLGNHDQGKFSIELWKKAFRDARERLCPIQAGGHECGCLSVLVILVMEQLVNRLDVAMFNAILRESAEEMPTDPVSDPICDSKVLPVPAGKSSFGAGAQLKNVIGNWSRWLTDLFGLEDDSNDDNAILGNGKRSKSFKAFRLLHALSDLMMLPFGMLGDASTRKEVCPMFCPTIIKRVLKNFVPDEFNPYPIPRNIIHAINSEEISDSSSDILTSLPCIATPTKYSPPPAALLTCVGEVGSQVLKSSRLSTLKKSYTSDDELDELDSPLTSIVPDSYKTSSALAKLSFMPKEKGSRNVVRYQLLREIWKDDN